MIRIAFLGVLDEPWILTEPELVTRHCQRIGSDGKPENFVVEHMASTLERKATREELEAWKSKP
jgi:hypothetical protein